MKPWASPAGRWLGLKPVRAGLHRLAGALVSLSLLLVHAPVGSAEEPAAGGGSTSECAREIAARVQRQYDSVRDFSARFSQTTRSALFGGIGGAAGDAAPVRGSVVLAKPGKMRWTYETPEPSLLVSDGKIMWLYSPGSKEAQRLPVTQGYLTGAAMQFLLGDGNLLEAFDVSAIPCDTASAATIDLTLVPREPASYERLGLRVAAKSGDVLGTSLVDLFGNETVIEFEGIERNQQPGDERFQFVPPEGVDVIDLAASP